MLVIQLLILSNIQQPVLAMSTPSMLFESYCPQLPLGDWQIVLSVRLEKGRIAVERRHSSDPDSGRSQCLDKLLYIETGIRAFRRQMPILQSALEKIDITGLTLEEVVQAVFDALSDLYGGSCGPIQFINGPQCDTGTELTDFLRQRKLKTLSDLGRCTGRTCTRC